MTTREEIISAAKECGMAGMITDVVTTLEELERFSTHFFEAGAASRDAEVADIKTTSNKMFDSLQIITTERDQLCAELVKALAACKAKDEAILQENYSLALSFQPDDSALKAWLGAPVAWEFTDAFGTHYTDDQRDWMDTPGIESVTCLYSPKGLK